MSAPGPQIAHPPVPPGLCSLRGDGQSAFCDPTRTFTPTADVPCPTQPSHSGWLGPCFTPGSASLLSQGPKSNVSYVTFCRPPSVTMSQPSACAQSRADSMYGNGWGHVPIKLYYGTGIYTHRVLTGRTIFFFFCFQNT